MVSSGEKAYKNFIGYKDDDHKIKLLCIMLPKMSAYVKSYDGEAKWMYFFIEVDELLETYNGISNRVSNSIKRELDCKPIYNEKFLKIKIRSYGDKTTDFHNKEVPKVCSNYTSLAVISLGFILKKNENHYPQVLLK